MGAALLGIAALIDKSARVEINRVKAVFPQ